MKKMLVCALTLVGLSATAAVATVNQPRHGARPVINSGSGVMPKGAQSSMPKARTQIARDNLYGAGFSPVMIGIFTPVQLPSPDFDIGGLRLSLPYSTCVNFDGLDIGVVGVTQNHGNGWLINVVSAVGGDGFGAATGGVNWYGGDFKGLHIGLANWTDTGDVFQIGLYNGGRDLVGHQIGVINTAEMLQGVQIGVVNVISHSDVSFMPIINWYF